MIKWIVLCAGAALTAGVTAAITHTDGGSPPETVRVKETSQPQECAFNRLSVGPDGKTVVAWLDRDSNALRSGARFDRSQVSIVSERDGARFFALEGNASAVNWRSEGDQIEFLLDRDQYALFAPSTSRLRVWPIASYWQRVDVKNQRWDGLREVIEDAEITSQIASYDGPFSRFAGSVVVSDENRYWSPEELVNASEFGSRAFSIFDLGSPLRLSFMDSRDTVAVGDHFSPRPVFESSTGEIVGSQSLSQVRLFDSKQEINVQSKGVVKDAVLLGDGNNLALLVANAAGAHFIVFDSPDHSKTSVHLCGTESEPISSAAIGFGRDDAGLLHSEPSRSGERTLAVRFPGGPFGAIEDGFPTTTTTRLINVGYDVLEIEGVGGRDRGSDQAGPRVTPDRINRSSAVMRKFILKRGYRKVIIIGESFGAFGAIDLALNLANDSEDDAHSQGDLRVSLVLLAPLTRLAEDRSMSGRRLLPGSLQEKAELLAFGPTSDRRALSNWYAEVVEQACSQLHLRVVIGSADRRTPMRDQSSCIRDKANVVYGRGHADLFDDPDAWTWLGT